MIRVLSVVLLLAFCASGASDVFSLGTSLTEEERARLKKTPTANHVLVEAYTETDRGVAHVIGFQFDTHFWGGLYWCTAIYGAVTGERGGYGIAALGGGYRWVFHPRVSWDFRGLVGSGGGGGLPAGGGLALQVSTGPQVRLTERVWIEARGGWLEFPTGTFQSPVVNVSVMFTGTRIILPY